MSDVQFAALLAVFFSFSAFVVWVLGGDQHRGATAVASPEPQPRHPEPAPVAVSPAPTHDASSPSVDQQIVDINLKPQSQRPSPIAPTASSTAPAEAPKPNREAPSARADLPPDAGISQIFVARSISDAPAATAHPQPLRPQFYDMPRASTAKPAAAAPSATATATATPKPAEDLPTPPRPATPAAAPAAQPAATTSAPSASPTFAVPTETPLPLAASTYAAADASAPAAPAAASPAPQATASAQPQAQTSSGWARRAEDLPPSDAVQLTAAAPPAPAAAAPSSTGSASSTVQAAPDATTDASDTVLLSTARRGTRLIGAGHPETEFFDLDDLPAPRPKTPSIWSRSYLRPSVAHTLPGVMEVVDEPPSVRAERIAVRAETLLVGKQGCAEAGEPKASSQASGSQFLAADIRYTLPPGALGND